MSDIISIKGNVIKINKETCFDKIEDILMKRFEDPGDLEKSLSDLYDPYLLADMDKAVKRIKEAYENKERVIIFGDYDVDGVTSTSILMHFFKKVGFEISYRLPHREKDGYGLKKHFIDEASELGVKLFITVDCGIKDLEVVTYAKGKGIDVIITDHHNVPDIISEDAVAIINPKRKDCTYPFEHLSGAGVAYKLMMALAREYLDKDDYGNYLRDSIDLAAIGTVADCMILTGENRIIVTEGLKQLKNSRSKGIRSLIEDKINTDLDADIFGFTIGPKLNAAGRMDTPYKAVNLILNNGKTLKNTLDEINKLNEERKILTRDYFLDAIQNVKVEDNLIIYVSKDIKHGIIGIIAGRLAEEYNKPTIVFIDDGEKFVGSCRSPSFFSIIDLLERHKKYFTAFGGHKQAAGLTIMRENFVDFKRDIIRDINKISFKNKRKEIEIDKIVSFNEIGFNFLEKVNKFKPFGMGNPKPNFIVRNIEDIKVAYLGKTLDHIRFTTSHGFKIFGFGFGKYYREIKNSHKIDLIFDINEDYWMGKKNLMLRVVDIVIY